MSFLALTPPTSMICNGNNYIHQANMVINPRAHEQCHLEMTRMWKRIWKKKVGHVLVVLGALVGALIPVDRCHSNANFAWTSTMFITVEINAFMFASNRPFVLALIIPFDIWTLSTFQGIQCYVVRNTRHFTNSKCWVASLLRFAKVLNHRVVPI